MPLAHHVCQNVRESSEGTRMGLAEGGVNSRRQRDAVRADVHPRQFESLRLLLVHAWVGRADLEAFGLLFDQKIDHRLLDGFMHGSGDLLEGMAVKFEIGGTDRPSGILSRLLL